MMYIDETYKRRVRIEGSPDTFHGFKLTVHDVDTGERIGNILAAVIYLCPGELNRADLTYIQHDERGAIAKKPDNNFEPIMGTVRLDNPEIALSAYERCNNDGC